MKRIILSALAAITLTGGIAAADHRRGWDRHDDRRHDRWERRDNSRYSGGTRVYVTDRRDRGYYRHDRVVRSRPVFRNNTFYFDGGYHRVYRAPVIRYRYRNYYQRPAVIVENYDPVPGYIWIAGNWQWNGYEWIWINGHYEVDASYEVDANYYYDGY